MSEGRTPIEPPIEPDDLLAIETVGEVHVSPDGTRVAYALTRIDAEADEYRSAVWVVPASGGTPERFTRGPRRDGSPRWSPDGRWLAFVSDRDGGTPQLHVMPAAGGEARRLTALEHGAGPAGWSPDGTRICFAARAPEERPPDGAAARARWAERPRVVTRASYKADGTGYDLDRPRHLFVVGVDDGVVSQISCGGADDQTPAWSPDGCRIAWSRARTEVADYRVSDIWVADADGGRAERLTRTVGRAVCPTWSPDGTTIACYGTDEQEPGFGESVYRVWTVAARGGEARPLTASYDRGAFLLPPPAVNRGPIWSPDGASLSFMAADAGNVHAVRVQVADGRVERVVGGERQIGYLAAGGGRLAFAAGAPLEPGDVYVTAQDGTGERRLTHLGEAWRSRRSLPRVERRAFASPHGGTIDGWVVHPAGGRGPAPLLVHIHGGPHSFIGSVFPHSMLVPVQMVRYPGQSHPFLGAGRPSHRVDYVRRVVEWVERYACSRGPAA